MKKTLFPLLTLVPALFLLDRLTKRWALTSLQYMPGGAMDALPGVFRFRYAENTGAAFSALRDMPGLVAALTAFLLLALLLALFLGKGWSALGRIALCVVLAGGLGNLIDRLVYGFVVDFIDLQFMRFAVFNVADICVCVGAGLMAIAIWKKEARHER